MHFQRARRPLRAAFAAMCALSLAASMAFPFVAIAQTEEANESKNKNDIEQTQLLDVKETAQSDKSVESQASKGQTSNSKITIPAANGGNQSKSESAEKTALTDKKADASIKDSGSNSSSENDGTDKSEDVTSDANEATINELSASDTISPQADEASTEYADVSFWVCPPGSYEGSGVSKNATIIKGSSFGEAKKNGTLSEDASFFFNLGTDSEISIGDVYPKYPGYTFEGWIDRSTGVLVTSDTTISPLGSIVTDLVSSWKKDGTNFSIYTGERWLNNAPSIYVVADGVLSGDNIPEGAQLTVRITHPLILLGLENEIYEKLDERHGKGGAHLFVNGAQVDLFADGKPVHDKFGTLKLSFYIPSDGVTPGFKNWSSIEVCHIHSDDSITYGEVQKPVNGYVDAAVTDLSKFAFAGIGKPSDRDPSDGSDPEQPGDNKPSDGDNQGDQKPGDNGQQGGNNQGNNGQQGNQQNGQNGQNGQQQQNANKNLKKAPATGGKLAQTGDDTRYILAGTTGFLACAAFFGGLSLLMGDPRRLKIGAHTR